MPGEAKLAGLSHERLAQQTVAGNPDLEIPAAAGSQFSGRLQQVCQPPSPEPGRRP